MKEALVNLVNRMNGHDAVAALAITLGAGIGALGLTYVCGYEILLDKGRLSIQKVASRPCIEG